MQPVLKSLTWLLFFFPLVLLQAQVGDTLYHDGVAAEKWDRKIHPELELPVQGGQLRQDAIITFWMHVEGDYEGQSVLIKAGLIPPRSGIINLSWKGWRHVVIPISNLKDESDGVGQYSKEFPLKLSLAAGAPDNLALAFADVRQVTIANGPGLTDSDLLEQINLNYPGLEQVRTAVKAGDQAAALAALAAYFRGRTYHLKIEEPSNVDATIAAANKILDGEINMLGLSYIYPKKEIDWKLNPTSGKENMTFEWGFSLNRHAFWKQLAAAYIATKDEKYSADWADQLQSWVEAMPAPAVEQEQGGSGWRGLEAGLRMSENWPYSWVSFCKSPCVSDATLILGLKSVWDHATFLAAHPYGPSNHFLIAMIGLVSAGDHFPEFSQAPNWRKHGIEQMNRCLTSGTLPEGAWYELSPSYHQWVTDQALNMAVLTKESGFASELPNLDLLQKMAEWNFHIIAPDYTVPCLNDGNYQTLQGICKPQTLALFPDSQLLRWGTSVLNGDSNPSPPSWTSEALPGSGYMIMRTGWKKDDSFVLMKTGPLGGWHGHQDALNLIAWFYGRCFLFSTSGYKYDNSIWRKYGPSTKAASTVMVDGLGQQRSFDSLTNPIGANSPETPAAKFITTPSIDYASGWYVDGYGATRSDVQKLATHHREVAFIKPASGFLTMMVVLDTLKPVDGKSHQYELRWQLKTTHWETNQSECCTWTTDNGQPNLAVLSITGAKEFHADSGVKEPATLGWDFPTQNYVPTPALTLRQDCKSTSTVRFLTLFVPFMGTTNNPIIKVESIDNNSWKVTLRDQPSLSIHLHSVDDTPGFAIEGLSIPKQ